MITAPDQPAGALVEQVNYDSKLRDQLIEELALAPAKLRAAVDGLSEEQLDSKYRNWSIRQITHHVADSHTHVYIRFKWTLTESTPLIKAYDEADWVQQPDNVQGDLAAPLALLEGLHLKWVQTLRLMSETDFERTFVHPETQQHVRLWEALNYYPWHARHHTGQILWMRENRFA